MSPGSSPLAGVVARLTDPHDRETYADLVRYFDSLPPDDEMFRLARLLGLLTLVGQRIPEAAATLTAELQVQAKSASAFNELFDDRLHRLAVEITEGVDTSTIARAMAESVRQSAGKQLADVRKLTGEVAGDLRLLSRTARVATVETAAEHAKLTELTLDIRTTTEAVVNCNRQQKSTICWLLFLSGFLSGILALILYIHLAQ
jgi:hypothetical protein